MKPYYTSDSLKALEKEVKTIPVDGEGRALPVQYDEHWVRSTILKLIADNRAQRAAMSEASRLLDWPMPLATEYAKKELE